MGYEDLILERRGRAGVITVNRPKKLNALSGRTLDELSSALDEVLSDDSLRGVVVTGSGPKAFVAGADIGELARLDPEGARRSALKGQRIFQGFASSEKVTIAAVNGLALGGGCELAMACHLRYVSPEAAFGQPEVKLGLIPGYGGTQRLPRLVGLGRALEILLDGNHWVKAEEAVQIGLANRLVPAEELLDQAVAAVERIAAMGPRAVACCVGAVEAGLDRPLPDALASEATYFGLCVASPQAQEGMQAFLERRAPDFEGK